jgi:adenine phosphoribosyltransferase
MEKLAERVKRVIREVPDFPKPGINFKDITTFLNEGPLFREVIKNWAEQYRGKVEFVVGIESRGFILGAPLAVELGVGFVPIRKKGKLPADKISYTYQLEYGSDTIEIHRDCFRDRENPAVLVVDDLIATGGTALAAKKLLDQVGCRIVAFQFLIELTFLPGRKVLEQEGVEVKSLVSYDSE